MGNSSERPQAPRSGARNEDEVAERPAPSEAQQRPQAPRSGARSEAEPSEAQYDWLRVPVELPAEGATRAFALASRKLLLCNADGTPYVIENVCPHTLVPLEGGAVVGTVLECPHHGGRIDLRDGKPLRLPIRRSVHTFAVRAASDGGLEVALKPATSFR